MADEQANSIDDPFAQLVRAHRDIESTVVKLERAATQLTDAAKRASALHTIADVLEYFEGPAAMHHADEEQTLFPLLRPLEDFAEMLSAFDAQHKMNEDTYVQLRKGFSRFNPASAGEFRELVARFIEMQRAHMLAEERALFPKAAAALSPEAIAQIHQEMAARRGM